MYLFIVTYVIVLVLPIASSVAIQRKTESVLREELIVATGSVLKQVRITIEEELDRLSKTTAQISGNPRIKSLLVNSRVDTRLNQYDVYETRKMLLNAIYTSRLVKICYLYFKGLDYVVSSEISSDRKHFYDVEVGEDSIEFEEWNRLMNEDHEGTILSLQDDSLYYIQSLISDNGWDYSTSVVYVLDKPQVRDLVASVEGIPGGSLFLIDPSGSVIVARDEDNEGLPDVEDGFTAFPDIFKDLSRERIVIHERSPTYTIDYVFVLPRNSILQKVLYIRRYARYFLIMTICLGVIAIGFFAYLQYSPLSKIVGFISRNKAPQREMSSRNPYEIIHGALKHAFDNEARYRDLSNRQLLELRDNFLYRMLNSLEMDSVARREGFRRYFIDFPHDSFAVFLVIMENDTVDYMESVVYTESDPNRRDGLNFWILKPFHIVVFIANFQTESWNIDDIGMAIRADLSTERPTLVTIAASSKKASPDDLPHAYSEALQALEYRDENDPGGFLAYQRIVPASTLVTYSLDDEVRLINLMKSGDFERAVALADAMMKDSTNDGIMTASRLTHLKYNLVSTFTRLVGPEQIQHNGEGVPIEEKDFKVLLSCRDLGDLCEQTQAIIRRFVTSRESEFTNTRHRKLVDDIRNYIGDHHQDSSLNISSLGDVFNLTPYYISRIFRDLEGISLLEYINRCRVDMAKKLLAETSMGNRDVARKSGFDRLNAFIRVFKNFEGITPGAYRIAKKG